MTWGRLKYIVPAVMALGLLVGGGALAADQNKVTILPKSQTVNNDYFAGGGTVEVAGTVNGDVYAAGGQVLIDGTVNGDVLAAGGTVTISGTVHGNVRATGGQLVINGNVERNMTLAGGNVQISGTAMIGGNVVAGGGTLLLDGPVKGNVKLGGGTITVSQSIGGNLEAATSQLVLGDGASVGGSVTYWSRNDASISSDAKIAGSLKHNLPAPSERKTSDAFNVGWLLYGLLTTLIVGMLLVALLPHYSEAVLAVLTKKPWASIGWGLVALLVTPLAIVLLLVTVLGIPFALILAGLYAVSLFLAPIWVVMLVGLLASKYIGGSRNPYLDLVIGAVIFALVRLIPIIGWIVSLLALLAGLGASLVATKTLYRRLRADKLV